MPLFVVPINANQVLRQIVIHSWIATATDVEALVTKGLGRRVWDGMGTRTETTVNYGRINIFSRAGDA